MERSFKRSASPKTTSDAATASARLRRLVTTEIGPSKAGVGVAGQQLNLRAAVSPRQVDVLGHLLTWRAVLPPHPSADGLGPRRAPVVLER